MHPESKKEPKTDLDKKFLYVVEQAMSMRGIHSDRAMSLELDRHPNFMNRVRHGLQSAPPDAWDALFAKYPAARNITAAHATPPEESPATGTVPAGSPYSLPTTLEACQLALEQHKRDLAAARAEAERLLQQVGSLQALLDSKDALLAAKEETIGLLRGGYSRPG